jgi:hypothetical protein
MRSHLKQTCYWMLSGLFFAAGVFFLQSASSSTISFAQTPPSCGDSCEPGHECCAGRGCFDPATEQCCQSE